MVDYTVIYTGENYQEYSLIFGVCESVRLNFGHITPVSSRITGAIADLTPMFHTEADPRVPVFSPGDRVLQVILPVVPGSPPGTVPFPFGTYTFSPNPSGLINRDFSETAVGKNYCYEHLFDNNGDEVGHTIIRVNLLDSETMQIEASYSPSLIGCQAPPAPDTTG